MSKPRTPFAYRPSKESLLHVRNASAEAKLQWLEEANAFVRQFVEPETRARWRVFVEEGASMKSGVDPVVREFVAQLRQRLGDHVRRVLLFGSRARGDAREDSDYDMLVVVDHRTPDVRATILEIEHGLMDRHGVLVATVLRSEEEWRQGQGLPLACNIAREGVAL